MASCVSVVNGMYVLYRGGKLRVFSAPPVALLADGVGRGLDRICKRLLPSGIGSLGLNGVYLYKRKHTVAEATVVVSTNNLLGIVSASVVTSLRSSLVSQRTPSTSGRSALGNKLEGGSICATGGCDNTGTNP